ncbi:MAG: pilus assembly protein TadG-related protein [Candidatus Korobacteraceae bacterium]
MLPFSRDEEGQVVVLLAISVVVLALMAGIGIDVGYLRYKQQQMQKAADAGALAAATVLLNYGNCGNCSAVATDDIVANGFPGSTITVTWPSQDPNYGGAHYVQVQVQQQQPLFFMNVGGFHSTTIAARSIGSAVGPASGCVYALDTVSGDMGFSVTGQFSSPCGIYADANILSNGTVNATAIGIVGTASGSGYTPEPTTGIPQFQDPLAGVTQPTPGSCVHIGIFTITTSTTLPNGAYCGPIAIAPTSGDILVTFQPGTYFLFGGLTVTGNGHATLVGSGVTFVNTASASYPYGPISLGGYAGFGYANPTLSSPTSGALAGILVFQDRSIPIGSSASTVDTSTDEVYAGAFYFPSTTLIYKGVTSGGVGGGSIAIRSPTLLVAWKINITGNVAFNNTYIPAFGGSPIHSAVLVQ